MLHIEPPEEGDPERAHRGDQSAREDIGGSHRCADREVVQGDGDRASSLFAAYPGLAAMISEVAIERAVTVSGVRPMSFREVGGEVDAERHVRSRPSAVRRTRLHDPQ